MENKKLDTAPAAPKTVLSNNQVIRLLAVKKKLKDNLQKKEDRIK